MDIKTLITLEVEQDGKKMTLLIPSDMQFGKAYDGVFQMLEQIVKWANESKEKMKPKKEEDKDKGE